MKHIFLVIAVTATAFSRLAAATAPVNIGEAEAQKTEEKIATVRRDILSKYETSLGELQLQFQKAADLEGALAVRAERERLRVEQVLSEKGFATEPKSLRALQQATLGRMQELVSGVVAEALPKLVEHKKQLTIDGRLDEAVGVRQAIERLQNANVPIVRTEAGSLVQAETLLRAYSADRSRADKTYKGVRILVRGVVTGYRIDPDNGKSMIVYLASGGSTGWIQCAFNLGQWHYREDRTGAAVALILQQKDSGEVRLARGMQVDILGDCTGWDEMVKLAKCDVPR
jgi:hypothetical protein